MRSIFIILILFTAFFSGIAQKKARDFKVTTTDRKTVELYKDYLNQGKVVLMKIFFVDCPPCNDIAPQVSQLYKKYGSGTGKVEFMELSNKDWDSDAAVIGYKLQYDLPFPGVSKDGGSVAAAALYSDNFYGPFFGTPTFVVIQPNGAVNFDPRGGNKNETIVKLDTAIAQAIRSIPTPPAPPPVPPADTVKPNPNPIPTPPPADTIKPPIPPKDTIKPTPPQDTTKPVTIRVDTIKLTGKLSYRTTNLGLVNMKLNWNNKDYVFNTDILGNFKVTLLDSGKVSAPATLTIDYNQAYNSEVDVLDLLSIQKHILGIQPFADFKQILAADADGDNQINVIDLLELRKLILGLYEKLPNVPSVYFIWKSPNNFIRNLNVPISYSDLKALNGLRLDLDVVKVGNVD